MIEFFRIKIFLAKEQWRTIKRYYSHSRFACADLALGFFAFFSNPYRVCRKFLQRNNESVIHAYGETPISEFQKLVHAARISVSDTFVEMGSGRGKLCFWTALFIGCNVRGIEWVPSFVRNGIWISKAFLIPVHFVHQSMFDVDLSEATVVYLYAIHLSDERMGTLAVLCEKMKSGSVVISIGEALASNDFKIEQVLQIRFPWGQTEGYIQRKI